MKRAAVSQNLPPAATEQPPAWFLFAPGAGAPSSSPWMQDWSLLLTSVGPVITFDYPYRLAGRRRPDPLPTLIEAHKEALCRAGETHAGPPWLVGKSMGSRVGCHVAAELPTAGVICFGYPLVSQSGVRRSDALLAAQVPLLLIQGTRDRLAPLDELSTVARQRSAPTRLLIVPSGDHSLEATVSTLRARGQSQAELNQQILDEIRLFLQSEDRPLWGEKEL